MSIPELGIPSRSRARTRPIARSSLARWFHTVATIPCRPDAMSLSVSGTSCLRIWMLSTVHDGTGRRTDQRRE
ncbi:hypothetical protein RHMOL_Rhmol10G0162300 [Rhododendron molle]|uniref:Uncharacterized protein n=1 Tax=Rhododendron molle TaxID=49168 RepID=A0ACC0M369_RHOML|nr:hypothetical protein RHMOL_Rhmol10G0162300 [Rhododendron molle]